MIALIFEEDNSWNYPKCSLVKYILCNEHGITCIPINSWASSADKDSPPNTDIVDEPSGLIISAKTEGLYTGCKTESSVIC